LASLSEPSFFIEMIFLLSIESLCI
jgi:hypothetical protein